MAIKFELISGFSVGFEIVWELDAAMIDLGIVRILFDWMKDE